MVVGESASIAKPCRSMYARIVGRVGGGRLGKRVVSEVEKENTWADVGDL